MAKLETKEVLERFKEVHGDTYDYSKVVYTTAHTKVEVVCKEHGSFLTKPQNHWNGATCLKCANEKRNNSRKVPLEVFIERASKAHNNKYDYSKVKYTTVNDKITIICPEHGEFLQRCSEHMAGHSCAKCANMRRKSLWTYTDWEQAGIASKNFEGYSVYIIKCYDENEEFFKVGKTFVNINKRFEGKQLPYKWVLVEQVYGDSKTISELEHKVHKELENKRYIPLKDFNGYSETFTEYINIKDLI